MQRNLILILAAALALLAACAGSRSPAEHNRAADSAWQLSEEEWRVRLSAEEFRVLREEGTERSFTSPLNANKREGVYACAGCGQDLFSSGDKFDSGTGWPSFIRPAADEAVAERVDRRFGMKRTEVHCRRCGGHLGHVFADGPPPTGLRYCINGVALSFEEEGSRTEITE